jgi:hypothetical protein
VGKKKNATACWVSPASGGIFKVSVSVLAVA